MKLLGRGLSGGIGSGHLLITEQPLSFFGGVDPNNGSIIDRWHPLYGKSLKEVVLAMPKSKGSTVGSYVIYAVSRNKVAPSAIIIRDNDLIVASGCIVGHVPLVRLDPEKWTLLGSYEHAIVNGKEGYVEVG